MPMHAVSNSFYRLIVERLGDKGGDGASRKRSTPSHLQQLDVTFNTAERLGLPAYVTAQLARQKVSGAFTVGDNHTYDGYFNGPLQRDSSYDFWLVAFSDVDGVRGVVVTVLFRSSLKVFCFKIIIIVILILISIIIIIIIIQRTFLQRPSST